MLKNIFGLNLQSTQTRAMFAPAILMLAQLGDYLLGVTLVKRKYKLRFDTVIAQLFWLQAVKVTGSFPADFGLTPVCRCRTGLYSIDLMNARVLDIRVSIAACALFNDCSVSSQDCTPLSNDKEPSSWLTMGITGTTRLIPICMLTATLLTDAVRHSQLIIHHCHHTNIKSWRSVYPLGLQTDRKPTS